MNFPRSRPLVDGCVRRQFASTEMSFLPVTLLDTLSNRETSKNSVHGQALCWLRTLGARRGDKRNGEIHSYSSVFFFSLPLQTKNRKQEVRGVPLQPNRPKEKGGQGLYSALFHPPTYSATLTSFSGASASAVNSDLVCRLHQAVTVTNTTSAAKVTPTIT